MGALMGAFHAAGNVSTGMSPEVLLHLAHAASNSCTFASAPLILPLLSSTFSRMFFDAGPLTDFAVPRKLERNDDHSGDPRRQEEILVQAGAQVHPTRRAGTGRINTYSYTWGRNAAGQMEISCMRMLIGALRDTQRQGV